MRNNLRPALFIFLVPIFMLAPACAQPAPNYDTLIQQGNTQNVARNYAQALATAQAAIKLNSNRWEAYLLAGGALMNLKRYDAAIDDLSKSIDHAPADKQPALRDLIKQCVLAETGATPSPSQPPAVPPSQPATTATQAEVVMWESIKNSQRPSDFQVYLSQYPNGAFAALAKKALSDLQAADDAAASKARLDQAAGIWTDPATGLMWASKDSGDTMNWNQANNYCGALQLGDYSGWRLATIDELNAIYDLSQHVNEYHIKGGINVLGWTWSGSLKGSRDAWAFAFSYGMRTNYKFSWDNDTRALCVRDQEGTAAQQQSGSSAAPKVRKPTEH